MKPLSRNALLAAVVAMLCGSAFAQTLYKLIDKNGKVTYSEEAPKNFDGKVIRIDIDPNANRATLPNNTGSLNFAAGTYQPGRQWTEVDNELFANNTEITLDAKLV